MTRNRQRKGALAIAIAAFAGIAIATPSTASGGAGDASGFTATPLSEAGRETGAKSTTGRLAETDPTLIGRTDATPVNVVVKLDYDATASYAGDIEGLEATSPSVTGEELTGDTAAEVAYESYTGDLDAQFRADLEGAVPSSTAGVSLTRVYGGVAVTLPANQVSKVLALPNVAAVQVETALRTVHTDSSTTFIGAPSIWAQEGGQNLAGQGVIFGDLDTGIWPEHPSFADTGLLGAPPAKADGTARKCDYGDNPLTPTTDVFVCNNKLIGGEAFLATYNLVFGGEVYTTARDSNGHGTHTSSTAAGNVVDSAPIFGVERGPISGVAPGAWVSEYKVCGFEGCFASDSAAAVAQAILDGVNVINFSIGGGSNPYSDVAELAFLDAYEAGVLVATSAGNSGPGAATTEHVSPWTITVAASTQTRAFQSTLSLTGTDGATADLVGSSITAGISAPLPIVLAQNIPGYDALCSTPLAAGAATGVIVACQRGVVGRVEKGFNVLQGGAAAMILYNASLQDTETDNHFLPTVHLADGTDFLAFLADHGGATATFTAGAKAEGLGDVMAAFSSRGPGGTFLKPDITAPGVQILAGHSPTPDDVAGGPPGQYYQAIAGTSMSSPHIAGSAILLKALHPNWTPGAIKSALMTTANENVLKEDEVTPTDPFDDGAGRVNLEQARRVKLVFDETALNMFNLGSDPLTALNVNTPSINVPIMPGSVTVTRTLTNTTDRNVRVDLSSWSAWNVRIAINPKKGTVPAGGTFSFDVTITSSANLGQDFGSIRIRAIGSPEMHIPVAWNKQQGAVTLDQTCGTAFLRVGATTECTVTATNDSFDNTNVAMNTAVNKPLKITGATGSGVTISPDGTNAGTGSIPLLGKTDATPSINPGLSPAGYLPLSLFGVTPIAVGDEEALNFNVAEFVFGGKTYDRVGVVSNGYIVLGGTTGSADIDFVPQELPDPTRPNGVLAPYWTDLDGTGAPGILAAELTDGVNTWLVLEWRLNLFGTTKARVMQVWIGVDGVEDVSYTYHPATLNQPSEPTYGLTVGAENDSGSGGDDLDGAAPASDYVITTTPGAPGGSASYTLTLTGQKKGGGVVTTNMLATIVPGTTTVHDNILVFK